jgi:methylthioribose-1-phosphate isomerase
MRTIEWDNGVVKMIDQRLLPGVFEIAKFDDYRQVARAIQEMYIRGAPAIGAAAAFGMALAARQSPAGDRAALRRDLEAAAEVLRQARPTAVNLFWAVDRMLRVASEAGPASVDDVRAAILADAQALADEDVEINRRMAAHGAALIKDGDSILHHCNTGALATVDYGTALGVIRMAHEQGKKIHVFVDETRPRLQGARLTAWELKQLGIDFTLIADNAAGHYMRTGQVNICFVGSDKLAVVAKENGIPFFPVVPTSTIDLNCLTGDHIPIEERDPEEVTGLTQHGLPIAPTGIKVGNPAFDVTPARYITGIVTENGVAYPPFDLSLRRVVQGGQQRSMTT